MIHLGDGNTATYPESRLQTPSDNGNAIGTAFMDFDPDPLPIEDTNESELEEAGGSQSTLTSRGTTPVNGRSSAHLIPMRIKQQWLAEIRARDPRSITIPEARKFFRKWKNGQGLTEAECLICGFTPDVRNGTNGYRSHIQHHCRNKDQLSIEAFVHRQPSSELPTDYWAKPLPSPTVRKALLTWIIMSGCVFATVEDEAFRQLAYSLNSEVRLPSRRTICRDINRIFAFTEGRVDRRVLNQPAKISLMHDAWTSKEQNTSYLGLMCQYIETCNEKAEPTETWGLKTIILSMDTQRDGICHTADNVAFDIDVQLLRRSLRSKVHAVVVDNGSGNPEMFKELQGRLEANGVILPDDALVRCAPHVINLVAKAFMTALDGAGPDSTDVDDVMAEAEELETRKASRKGKAKASSRTKRSKHSKRGSTKRRSGGKRQRDAEDDGKPSQRKRLRLLRDRLAVPKDQSEGESSLPESDSGEENVSLSSLANNRGQASSKTPDTGNEDQAKPVSFGWAFRRIRFACQYIKSSTKRYNIYKTTFPDAKIPVVQCDTRWNTAYDMLRRAIDIKQHLLNYPMEDERGEALWPMESDFEMALPILAVLEKISLVSNDLQTTGADMAVGGQVVLMDLLLDNLEDLADAWKGNAWVHKNHAKEILAAIDCGKAKLQKYYRKTGSEMHAVATYCDPRLKSTYWNTKWRPEGEGAEIQARQTVVKVFQRYNTRQTTAGTTAATPQKSAKKKGNAQNKKGSAGSKKAGGSLLSKAVMSLHTRQEATEMDRYEATSLDADEAEAMDSEEMLSWWANHRNELPTLSRMAADFLAVPTGIAELERWFSIAKHTLPAHRASVSIKTMNRIMQLRSWIAAYGSEWVHADGSLERYDKDDYTQSKDETVDALLEDERT